MKLDFDKLAGAVVDTIRKALDHRIPPIEQRVQVLETKPVLKLRHLRNREDVRRGRCVHPSQRALDLQSDDDRPARGGFCRPAIGAQTGGRAMRYPEEPHTLIGGVAVHVGAVSLLRELVASGHRVTVDDDIGVMVEPLDDLDEDVVYLDDAFQEEGQFLIHSLRLLLRPRSLMRSCVR